VRRGPSNIVAKKRARQVDVDSDYLFANRLQILARATIAPFSARLKASRD
jgi:hypothetical protein